MTIKPHMACVVLVAALAIHAAPKSGLIFHGSMYTDLSLYHYNFADGDSVEFGGRNTLSLECKNANRKYGKVEINADVFQLYGVQADAVFGGLSDAFLELIPIEGAPVLLDLRTLYFSVYLPFVDISVGRQIINFGKGFIFSPVDAFSTVDIVDLNFRRRGSDAVAARFPLGNLAGVDILSEFPVGDDVYATAAKAFAMLFDFDWSVLGIYRHRRKEIIGGFGFKGDIEIGIYGEAAQHYFDRSTDTYFEAMLGADYSFLHGDLMITAEYMHSGRPDSIASMWGKHNGFVSILYSINEIMNVSGNVIQNFSDEITIGTIQYFYNMRQNVDAIVYLRGYHASPSGMPAFPDLEYALRLEVKF